MASDRDIALQSAQRAAGQPRDQAARRAGVLLLLTAAATLAMVSARVAADTDQSTLLESLRAIADNTGMYSLSGAARTISGVTLVAGALYLSYTWIIQEGFGTPLVPYLLVASGVLTAMSGVYALLLATTVGEASEVSVTATRDALSTVRWVSGKAGFTVGGLALVVAGVRQWQSGGMLMRIAPASVVIGIGMQLIWVDAATVVHRVTGVGFVVWLALIGVMLVTGRVERHFARMRQAS